MTTRPALVLGILTVLTLVAAVLAVGVGSVPIPPATTLRYFTGGLSGTGEDATAAVLLQQVRLPRALTAMLAGVGLAVAGLLMQTIFANPLADPFILGVSSGASLGVAIAVLGGGTLAGGFVAGLGLTGRAGLVTAAAVGALAVLLLVLLLGRRVRSVVALLLIGVMIGSATTALVSLLLAFSAPDRIQKFVLWGLGSVGGTTWPDLGFLAPAVGIGAVLAAWIAPSLNAMLLGEKYAASMGVAVGRIRMAGIVATAVMAGAVTAFCGPIAFVGIAVPHLARMAVGRADHRWLVPASALMGAVVLQLCAVVAQLPGADGVLPLNVVTAAVGAPVVIIALLRSRTLAAGAS